ncbi:MAG TPA: PKD domain-containing protein [Candidatus Nanoarchaeia archaeon]|nr:PKD domain-containing protein [Candidatus Nanoarchaeia archaeon]
MANKIFIFVLLFLVFSLGVNAAKDSNFNNVQDAEQPQITNRITIFTGLPIIGIAFNPILGFITKQNTIQTNTNTITTDYSGLRAQQTGPTTPAPPEPCIAFPVANAGPDQTVNAGSNVFLDGSMSYDSNPLLGGIASWNWDFGDGETGNGEVINHIYVNPGTYTARLTVISNCQGIRGEDTAIITVLAAPNNIPPVAVIEHVPTTIRLGDSSQLDGFRSYDPDALPNAANNGIVSYSWNFGDGTSSTSTNNIHTYASTGTFMVTLTVTDAAGAQGVDTETIVVSALPMPMPNRMQPVAIIDSSMTSFTVDQIVIIKGIRSYDPDAMPGAANNGIVLYSWNFGDGTSSNLQTNDHKYNNPGTYTVTLTVTDVDGLTGVATQNLIVSSVGMQPPGMNPNPAPNVPPVKRNINDDEDNIKLSRIEPTINSNSYRRGQVITYTLKITNEGSDEQVDLIAQVPQFNYRIVVNNIKVDRSQVKWITVQVPIPSNTVYGKYFITWDLIAKDGDTKIKKYSELVVASV